VSIKIGRCANRSESRPSNPLGRLRSAPPSRVLNISALVAQLFSSAERASR
jgi:hypothetical protein